MMAKLIITGSTRAQALARAGRALAEFHIDGVASTLPFHRAVIRHPDFIGSSGFNVHTRWIESEFAEPLAAALRVEPTTCSPLMRTSIEIDGRRVQIGLPDTLLKHLAFTPDVVAVQEQTTHPPDDSVVAAPIAGTLHAWNVSQGDAVEVGQCIAIIEDMKMEMPVLAHRAGRISLTAHAGQTYALGTVLAKID